LDPAVDWNPVWSPDGSFLYFASDRAGPMNLWRVPIEERTGRPLGPPQPINAPSAAAALISFSKDGREAVYTAFADRQMIQRVTFDPAAEATIGPPATALATSRSFEAPSPSA